MKKRFLSFLWTLLFVALTFNSLAFAEDLKLPSLFEPEKSFSFTDFKGKVVLLNFWTIRCPYCRMELPVLNKAQDAFSEDVRVISVLFARGNDIEEAKDWIRRNKLDSILFLLDAEGKLFEEFGVMGVPYTVFFDKEGKKVTQLSGAFPESIIFSLIQKILGK